ncbi:DNA damage-induced apoptosis suppressor protein isoform X1 [Pimephales promelas]|uniref:DNA damage-induced apoptosis suppressor protein isoform X1 n=1 Tax=Pimephales promelas TaxID=90988 RepID=UPI0019555FA5|nr:DNA damage-induced apoptosis suppressor protein isoform X1 [Pimephales promelas]
MSDTRALVSCTILSLQDSCFIYPCCKGCLSRLIQGSKRATCGRCGFTCDLQNVDYRYRLSFNVSRNQDIFGVTVFGGCLNPFFGITAGCLQRFIDSEKTDGTHTVQQLLVKAVEDCFIGRCVIFGLKVPHNKTKTSSLSGQLVACQIISPCESLTGFTVIAYFKNLLQANSHLRCSESANNICPSQQKDSQSSQKDELNGFDYTPPSCARLDSQPSSDGFTISSPWQSPGLCFPPEKSSNQLSRDCDLNIFSLKTEETRTCKCTCQSNISQLKHVNCIKDELKNETKHEKSFSSSCDMFESSSAHLNSSTACDTMNLLSNFSCENNSEITTSGHCLVRAKSGDDYDSSIHEKSLDCHSGQNICFGLEDAPLSESLHDFVWVEPQISEINDTKECSSGKRNEMIQVQNRCSLTENSVVINCISKTTQMPLCGDELTSPMRNVNNISWEKNDENECPENLEIKMNIAKIPKTPTVLCTANSSGLKTMPFSPDITCAFNHPTNNGLSFSNKKRTLKRKKLTKSRPSVAFCSVNHEESKYSRHCAQSEVHSVNCKVKQELIVFDDHGEKYNCSVDLFASGQSSMDMNISDVTEISKVNELRNVNTSEPGVSDSLLFSPCLQSTPLSYHHRHSCEQKSGRTRRRVISLCSRAFQCEIQSKVTDLGLSDKRQHFDQLLTVGSEGFSGETDTQDASCNLSVNEWSRDLFEN